MKKILSLLLFTVVSLATFAQGKMEITGTVTDEKNEPMIGVTISVKDSPGMGTVTGLDGHYKISVNQYSYLIFTYLGYEKQEIFIKDKKVINVSMKPSKANVLNDVIVTGLGTRKKITVTGAVTTVDVDQLKTPTASLSNALAGNVPGIFAQMSSGQPGSNVSEFWIRGLSTFGGGSNPLVLVDGFERDLNDVNVEDVQSITVLKDASATAIYGSRGANGVILITTKHGKEGKVNINAKVETSYSARTMTPKLIDGVTYAQLENQALIARNQEPAWTQSDINLFKSGLDPDLYANTDWMKLLLKKGAPTYRANMSVSGGGSLARYFLSGSYVDESGIYRVDKDLKKEHNTNADYHRWNYRMNTDVNITKTTLLSLGVSGSLDAQNSPAAGDIWTSLLGQIPIVPVKFSNGYYQAQGTGFRTNPWVYATQEGYAETWKNKIQLTLNLNQDLGFITKGLSFFGRFGYDTNDSEYNQHSQWPEQWTADNNRDDNGNIVFTKVCDQHLMTLTSHSYGQRMETLEAELHYNRIFGSHTVGAVAKYTIDRTVNTSENTSGDYIQNIDYRHQGMAGQITYGFKERYFADFNFGYNGSENFARHHQYGFFPAFSVAWNIGEEPWIQKNLPWMNMLKVRFSDGKVGNDNLGTTRFPYQSTFQSLKNYSYQYQDIMQGSTSSTSYQGLTYARISSPYITWEMAHKKDIGVDFSFFDDQISGTVDYYDEQRSGIYQSRSYLPYYIGLNTLSQSPGANIGKVSNKGVDGNIALKQKIGEVNLTLRANMTYSKNKILEYDEEYSRYPYTCQTGYSINQARGYIALGLFKSYDDIRNSPQQTFGDVAPGDIKYKDVNGDGIIDSNDMVPIGNAKTPNLMYGFGLSLAWKNFDFNVLFQGAGKSSFFQKGYLSYAFANKQYGNILQDVIGKYWELGVNEDPNAKYPRLTYGWNSNNYQNSTYWLRDGRYLRLKNLEIGYTIPKQLLIHLHVTNARFYFMGTNLLTFSKFKLWDPELSSETGEAYPLSRVLTLGLTLSL